LDAGIKDAGKDSSPDTQIVVFDPDTRPADTLVVVPDPDTRPADTRIIPDTALPDTMLITDTPLPPDLSPDTTPIDGASLVLTGCAAPPLSQRYFCDDFESGLDKWIVSGRDWNTTATASRSPSRCITDSPEGNYPKGAKNEIVLAASVDLTTATSPVLTFWHMLGLAKYASLTQGDEALVYGSIDGGTKWVELSNRYDSSDNTTTWSQIQLSLTAYVGK
jgi:hypothetical protein